MIRIDGSQGEGGGQIFRSSLALSLITGKPFRIEGIRAGRKKPGLMRQHLTALNAAVEVGAAAVTGDAIGSQTVVFEPRTIRPGAYTFSVGTAGSCALVLQTVLPALILADRPSTLELHGGTHNPFAPPFDFLQRAFLPLLERMGARVTCKLERVGFYPGGGGAFTVQIEPAKNLLPLELLSRGALRAREARASVAQIPHNVAIRELKTVAKNLGWPDEVLHAETVRQSRGPGNVLVIALEYENLTEVFTGFGQRGVTAEMVARKACQEVKSYLANDAPVGRYLADQLLIPMAVAGGGVFRTLPMTRHTQTNIQVIQHFLPINMEPVRLENNVYEIRIG